MKMTGISVRDAVNLDPQVAGGAVNLKEKDSAEFPSVLSQDDSPLGSNSVVIRNASIRDVQLEYAHVQFSNSSDAQTLLEKEEENTNSNILSTSVDRTEVSTSQGEYEDLERVLSRDLSGLDLSDQNNEVTDENSFTFNPSQLTGKNYASPDVHVIDSLGIMNKELVIECKDIDPKSETQEDVREHEEYNKSVGTSSESHQTQDEGLLLKATEDVGKHSSLPTINYEPAAQNDSSIKHDQGGQPSKEISGVSAAPVQDQSGNVMVKHISSGIDASVYSSSRCDSLEAN
ncbi:uncharacterized protein [Arachis hypogaea]|uniref:uncharacterized protein n=1 Tax=Arachis hypogaea TaxID=3818 RepID=UPI000DED10A5|nr:uncharacterized protein DS421_4g122480 [Arachis hypogaea]